MRYAAFPLLLALAAGTSAADPKPLGAGSIMFMKGLEAKNGTVIDSYTLSNGKMSATVINYGAILTKLQVPDAQGKLSDVVLGFDEPTGYVDSHPYFGGHRRTGRQPHRPGKIHPRRQRLHPCRQ